jgi:hypothetical protein
MKEPIDLTGERFGRLTVLRREEKRPGAHTAYWTCQCDCGTVKSVSTTALKGGYSQSCGCLRRELRRNSRHKNPHLYQVWQDMRQRCTNPNNKYFGRYGGRGISVCAEWAEEYEPFYTWAVAHGYQSGLQIDRIDNDGDYTPDNCRWATAMENTNNRSVTRRITYQGETHTFREWAEITGIPARRIRSRYEAGKPASEIFDNFALA